MNAEQLLVDVTNHKLTVRLDSGVYRHLVFRQPSNSWNMWFEIITWPGSLTIHGDMGTWSFSRVNDMFTFFRSGQLRINASYWCEKISSESRFGGPSEKFNADTFKVNVLSSLDGYGLSDQQKADIVEALEEEVFGEEDESAARRALSDFKHEDFTFSDSWEIGGKGYAYHYLWCLHAIVWGIQQYDARADASAGSPATNGIGGGEQDGTDTATEARNLLRPTPVDDLAERGR
jgi:hypothetical protein